MGMFTKYGSYTESAAINDADIIAQECFEDNMHTAALRVVAESESNWNQIMQAMAIQELAAYEETGDADYYVTEAGEGFLSSVKAFFKKLLEKIKGIFNKFISIVDSWAKSDKDFVNKYKKKILSANTKDFEFQGYEFTYNEFNPEGVRDKFKNHYKFAAFDKNKKDTYDEMTKNLRGDELEDELDDYRGSIINTVSSKGFSGKSDSSDFSKDLFEALRNGESSKETIDNISPINYLNIISKTEDIKKKGKKAYDNMQKGINDAIKECDRLGNEISKPLPKGEAGDTKEVKDAKASYVALSGAYSGWLRNIESINTTAYGAWLQAVKDQNRQAKAVCVKLMSYAPKNESTSYYEEGGSLLGNIRMI